MERMSIQEYLDASPVPTESVEQQRLIQWAKRNEGAHPELEMLYHIPNEGKRSRKTGARLKAEGLRSGVPDLCLPVARCGCHALYIELKRMRGGRPTQDQLDWIDLLTKQGNMAMVCCGWEQAAEVIERYLKNEM